MSSLKFTGLPVPKIWLIFSHGEAAWWPHLWPFDL